MKSPAELRAILRKQWENASKREARLMVVPGAWPMELSIGRPSARDLKYHLDKVKRHVEAWKDVKVGRVEFKSIRYRATGDEVSIPIRWFIDKPSEWLAVCCDTTMKREFQSLSTLIEDTDKLFHPFWIRHRSAWRDVPIDEVVLAARVAMKLEPNMAKGRPLRTLSIEGIDTKFFERHARLLTKLLDLRYEGEVGRLGLEAFLGAWVDGDHWLLVIDLDGSLLPFRRQRVAASEWINAAVNCQRLLIIENEKCEFQLQKVPGTLAVLGSGFDLQWMQAGWLDAVEIAYWGDIDTWGLQFLAQARQFRPELTALMMTEETFEMGLVHQNSQGQSLAVIEPVPAGEAVPPNLRADEKRLYQRLLIESKGRLEQEFLPIEVVHQAIFNWSRNSGPQS
jgi:hypothetical protein